MGDETMEPSRELLATCYWGWSDARLYEVLDELGSDGILVGIAVNHGSYIGRFDRLVLLELDRTTQRERISSRHPLIRKQIEDGLPVFQAQMLACEAARVDATQPTNAVTEAVVRLLGH